MRAYPGSENERRFPREAVQRLVTSVFQGCGMSADDAGLVAETLVVSDLRGVHSHGVMRVPWYQHKLLAEGVDPKGKPRVARDSGAALLMDGGNSMGQVGSAFAMRAAIERARTTGVAMAALRGSNHCGAMAYYALLAVPEDMIGLATTNALPSMAPYGGLERIVGINPLAIAVPAGQERPLCYDAAFSYSAHGKIQILQQKGATVPEGWATDQEGRPTTDPARALAGFMMPIGGYKGYDMAMLMGILSAVLSGASYGTELGSLEAGAKPGHDGQFFAAIRIAAFEDVSKFKRTVDGIVRQARACRKAPGFERVYVAGELEDETAAEYGARGIPLNDVTVKDLAAAARRVGVDPTTTLGGV